MKVQDILRGMKFLDTVVGKRTEYQIFSSRGGYILLAEGKNRNSGSYTYVDKKAVNRVYKAIRGKSGIATSTISGNIRLKAIFRNQAFLALNIIYILVAEGQAKIDHRFTGRSLKFNVHS